MDRRTFLASTGASAFFAGFPVHGFTQDLPPGRIVMVILEGGMDGLTAVPPIGDDDLMRQRRNLVATAALEINPFFGLHPALKTLAGMLSRNEAAIVHAASFPYTRRSHFEGQNIVESGVLTPFSSATGWLGRAMDLAGIAGRAMALDTPLVIRGATGLDNFYPASIVGSSTPASGLLQTLAAVHSGDIAETFSALEDVSSENAGLPRLRDPKGLALAAGKAMREENGPRVAVIRVPEFDTHANQGADDGFHGQLLGIVDDVFKNLKAGLGPLWDNTIVMTATEFGRTVRENGSQGTDHGYGSVGFLAGGLVKQASVLANWPGLRNQDLFEERDLMATMDYRAICAACIEAALGLDHGVIAERVFMEPHLLRVHDLVF